MYDVFANIISFMSSHPWLSFFVFVLWAFFGAFLPLLRVLSFIARPDDEACYDIGHDFPPGASFCVRCGVSRLYVE